MHSRVLCVPWYDEAFALTIIAHLVMPAWTAGVTAIAHSPNLKSCLL